MRRCSPWLALGCVAACASGAARPAPAHPAAPPAAVAPAPSPAPVQASTPAPAAHAAAVSAPALPDQLEAGSIARSEINAVLAAGVGRFLQRLRAEPRIERGRFAGWRLLRLPDAGPAPAAEVLVPGDVVLRVNGQSIERPEQFKNVWDSMATSSELLLDVERAGKRSQVRYRIVD
jgi:type II secretory pathway component PulC